MLGQLRAQPPDKIIRLIKEFRDDPRDDKVDLGVGVYRDSAGVTPIMRSVKAAERILLENESTKTYTGIAGDPSFHAALTNLVLGDSVPPERIAAAHTPGGTGAVHQALELVKMATPEASTWISVPSWPNHMSMVRHLGIRPKEHRYFDSETRAVDFESMTADLSHAEPGDAVILHGCCHNPTGADLSPSQWSELAELLLDRKAIPLVDIAYQGFGLGLDEDAEAVRKMAATFPEMLVAASCSKNFGIYRERTGLVIALAPDEATRNLAQSTLVHLNRQNFSFPPDHGARLVTMILGDDSLRSEWREELDAIRENLDGLRSKLAGELRARAGSDRFAFIANHRGMFSLLGATAAQVAQVRERNAIYMVDDSRINVAGLNAGSISDFADALIAAGV